MKNVSFLGTCILSLQTVLKLNGFPKIPLAYRKGHDFGYDLKKLPQ
jgi:hypothetical protein